MNILITGATGFIGSHLVKALVCEGHFCRCLVRKTSNVGELKKHDVELFYGDITNPDSLQGIAEGIDLVYHLAAMGHVSAISDDAYQRFRRVNVYGTENLAEKCVKESIQRFVHFSSTAAMGLIKKPIAGEDTPCQPSTPYQKSKFDSEQVILSYWKKHNLPAVILRPCMAYGPGGEGEFLKWCCWIKKGVFPKVGGGKSLIPMVHVEDVVRATILAGKRGIPGEVYLITSEESFELGFIRDLVIKHLNIRRPYIYVPTVIAKMGARLIEGIAQITKSTPIVTHRNIDSIITDRVFDTQKSKICLGYASRVPVTTGVKETLDWYLKDELL